MRRNGKPVAAQVSLAPHILNGKDCGRRKRGEKSKSTMEKTDKQMTVRRELTAGEPQTADALSRAEEASDEAFEETQTIEENLFGRMKRRNKILFRPDDECFSCLRRLISQTDDRRAVVLWSLSLAQEGVGALRERGFFVAADAAESALSATRAWAAGEIKMPAAKREILACHARAKAETDAFAAAMLHAAGQACAVVHSVRHALGFPVYELTVQAIRFLPPRSAVPDFESLLFSVRSAASYACARIREYEEKLCLARRDRALFAGPWASFLIPSSS